MKKLDPKDLEGSDGQEGRPVGTVYLGLSMDGHEEAQHVRLPGDRERVRQYAVISVLNLLRLRFLGAKGTRVLQ